MPFIIQRYVRYGLRKVNCSILFSTKGMEYKAFNWCISSHSYLWKLQEAFLTVFTFFVGDLLWTKTKYSPFILSYIYSARTIIIHPKHTPLENHKNGQRHSDLQPSAMLWANYSCFIESFQGLFVWDHVDLSRFLL